MYESDSCWKARGFNKSVPIFCRVVHGRHLQNKQKAGGGLGEVDIKLAHNERLTITILTCIGWEGEVLLVLPPSHIAGIASFATGGDSWES